ncbi:MAG: hypothetical protein ACRYG8_36025 [Janthinobacterium lividum]
MRPIFPSIETSDPMVVLAPDDADSAFAAGVQFARALAGAENAAFVMAVGEQGALIRNAVRDAGYPHTEADQARTTFEAGARTEWRRISSSGQSVMWGDA